MGLELNILKEEINENWTINDLANKACPTTWEEVFNDAKNELDHISNILQEDEKKYGKFYPLKKDIFAAFKYTQLKNIKAVIIGNEPYSQTITLNKKTLPKDMGLSYSVRKGDNIPSSIKNIYKELQDTVRGFDPPNHGDLTEWARQGVLLLNSTLTVRPGQQYSHNGVWDGFIYKVLKAIEKNNPICVFILWGKDSNKIKELLNNKTNILESPHPSGLSAKRGFFGSDHFNKVNDIILKCGGIGISWKLSKYKSNLITESSLSDKLLNNNNSSLLYLSSFQPF